MCTNKCGQQCSVPPCNEPCEKMLKCGHPCVGYCGDPCPPLCRICDKDTLTEIFFGDEDEADARFVLLVDCGHTMESQGMEHWMNTIVDNSHKSVEIKACPKCKSPILMTQRYSDYVKNEFEDLTNVKAKHRSKKSKFFLMKDLYITLQTLYRNTKFQVDSMYALLLNLGATVNGNKKTQRNLLNNDVLVTACIARMQIASAIFEVLRRLYKKEGTDEIIETFEMPIILEQLEFLFNQLVVFKRVSEQQTDDFDLEINRLSRMVDLIEIVPNRNDPTIKSVKELYNSYDTCRNIILVAQRFTRDHDRIVTEQLEELKKAVKSNVALSNRLKMEIVRAIGLQKGHWYKCPNGHFYAIGECGGAMEVGKCPDCGAPIGGMSHRLLPSNQHAGEMDNSQYPAWSDNANMENYVLDY